MDLEADKKYSIVMVSPDCSNCSLHWYASDISTRDVTTTPRDVTMTTHLPYIPPVPLKGTGFYRYALVLLEERSQLPADQAASRSTTLLELIASRSLTPLSLAFFQSTWDESVGGTLARAMGRDEPQYTVERSKDVHEHYAEKQFMVKEWQLKTDLM